MQNNFLNFTKSKVKLIFLVAIILLPLFGTTKSQDINADNYDFYIKEFNSDINSVIASSSSNSNRSAFSEGEKGIWQ